MDEALKKLILVVSFQYPADILRKSDVFIKSKRRHFDEITTKWCSFDVITTLLLRHVFSGYLPWRNIPIDGVWSLRWLWAIWKCTGRMMPRFVVSIAIQQLHVIGQSHKSHNAFDKYPTLHHFVTEMCKHVHISIKKWCFVRYGTGAWWDLWMRPIPHLLCTYRHDSPWKRSLFWNPS